MRVALDKQVVAGRRQLGMGISVGHVNYSEITEESHKYKTASSGPLHPGSPP